MTAPVRFGELLAALRDSLIGAREATSPPAARDRAPRIVELTLSLEGTLYQSVNGLGLRLGHRPWRRRQALQHLQIRVHGHAPIITEVSINGQSICSAADGLHSPEKDHEAHT